MVPKSSVVRNAFAEVATTTTTTATANANTVDNNTPTTVATPPSSPAPIDGFHMALSPSENHRQPQQPPYTTHNRSDSGANESNNVENDRQSLLSSAGVSADVDDHNDDAAENSPTTVTTTCCVVVHRDFILRSEFSVQFTVPRCLCDLTTAGIATNYFRANDQDPRRIRLSSGARRILESPNAGGNSIWSEVLSFEVLKSLFGAKLLCTEMQISYFPMGGKITDYSCMLFGQPIGVSVTRALKFQGEFTDNDAEMLLSKKLYGILESSRLVVSEHRWKKQMLHIWAENRAVAVVLNRVWAKMKPELVANTMVLITVTEHNAAFIFKNSANFM